MGYITTAANFSYIFSVYLPGILEICSIFGAILAFYIYLKYTFLRLNIGQLISKLMFFEIVLNLTSLLSLFYFDKNLI